MCCVCSYTPAITPDGDPYGLSGRNPQECPEKNDCISATTPHLFKSGFSNPLAIQFFIIFVIPMWVACAWW